MKLVRHCDAPVQLGFVLNLKLYIYSIISIVDKITLCKAWTQLIFLFHFIYKILRINNILMMKKYFKDENYKYLKVDGSFGGIRQWWLPIFFTNQMWQQIHISSCALQLTFTYITNDWQYKDTYTISKTLTLSGRRLAFCWQTNHGKLGSRSNSVWRYLVYIFRCIYGQCLFPQ